MVDPTVYSLGFVIIGGMTLIIAILAFRIFVIQREIADLTREIHSKQRTVQVSSPTEAVKPAEKTGLYYTKDGKSSYRVYNENKKLREQGKSPLSEIEDFEHEQV